jgi:hypothetical protein
MHSSIFQFCEYSYSKSWDFIQFLQVYEVPFVFMCQYDVRLLVLDKLVPRIVQISIGERYVKIPNFSTKLHPVSF